jgi:uncharacterized linocin/CFP29 family protein
MIKLIGADELHKRGMSNVVQMRPVLGLNADPFAEQATLRKDEWEQIDARVNEVMRQRLTVVSDLRGRGLVTRVSLGTVLRRTERLADMDDAEVSFDGDTAPQRDRPDFLQEVIPVPVIAKDFEVNWRQLAASRERGEPLDVTAAALAARKVADKIQDLFANGYGLGPGTNPASTDGLSIPGLSNAASALTVSGSDWATSGTNIIADVVNMLETAYNANLFGPFLLYVPKNYWAALQDDYSTSKGDRTFLERIRAFDNIEDVRPLDSLAAGTAGAANVHLVQMTEDVWDLTEAQDVTTVQWEKNPFVTKFRVLFVGGPHIKKIERQGGATIHGIVRLV